MGGGYFEPEKGGWCWVNVGVLFEVLCNENHFYLVMGLSDFKKM